MLRAVAVPEMQRQVRQHGADIDAIYELLTELKNQGTTLDAKATALDTRISALDTKVSALDTKVSALDTKVSALDTKVEGGFAELSEKFDALLQRLSEADGSPA
jgi:predicted  nucleic acid-binding Zn-ribbon protein